MPSEYSGSILLSLRRIIRSIDQHNKQLGSRYKLTVPQLVCLRQLLVRGPMPPGQLSREVYLSQATITGIMDRLEAKGLISRERSTMDRRKVCLALTDSGRKMAEDMPWPLQERFAVGLNSLSEEDQKGIDDVLKKLVDMMEAPAITVWPFGGNDVAPNGVAPSPQPARTSTEDTPSASGGKQQPAPPGPPGQSETDTST